MSKVKVWIDQDLCTGDGLCVEICPPLFDMHDDGLAYVKEADWPSIYESSEQKQSDPIYKMGDGQASVPDNLVDDAIEAADECPGECIFIEVVE